MGFLRFALLTGLMCVAWCGQAQADPVKQTGYITMSDGVKLRYAVELPAAAGRFPVALKYDGYCEGTDPMTCNEVGKVTGAKAPAGYPACDTLLNQPCRPDAFR
jgi:predicted acyl esterase